MPSLVFGEKIVDKYPFLISLSAFIHNNIPGRNVFKIKGNNIIMGLNRSFVKKIKVTVDGDNNHIDFGETCYMERSRIYIHGNNNKICFGKRVYASGIEIHIEDNGNTLTIGDHVSFSGYTHLALTEGKNINIGSDCMFAPNTTVRTGDSHSILELQNGKRINGAKDVFIGEHVWLGDQVILLKGASIPAQCIVGSGSIVTRPFTENNIVIAGNPAKVIKHGVNWVRERV